MTSIRTLSTLFVLSCALAAGSARAEEPAGTATVPDCVGLDLKGALDLARQAGFQPRAVFGAAGAAGFVVGQQPGGLARRAGGGELELNVAGQETGGPAEAQPPAVAVPTPLAPTEVPPPTVRPVPTLPTPPIVPAVPPTAPAPTAPKPGLTTVDLAPFPEEVAAAGNGPPTPTLVGLRREQVKPLVGPWLVAFEFTLTTSESVGRVLEQDPAPGSPLAQGATISILLGALAAPTPNHRQVPAVAGLGLDEAVTLLRNAGFTAAFSAKSGSPEAERGRVLRQSPRKHAFALPGQPVRLVVAR